jgi:hypothetical protein
VQQGDTIKQASQPGNTRRSTLQDIATETGVSVSTVSAVLAGEFWPPRELTGRDAQQDEFAELFHGGAEASIAWEERS